MYINRVLRTAKCVLLFIELSSFQGVLIKEFHYIYMRASCCMSLMLHYLCSSHKNRQHCECVFAYNGHTAHIPQYLEVVYSTVKKSPWVICTATEL